MQLNYKQSQFELFPGAVNGSSKTHRPQFLFSSLTLSLENIVISGIVVLMSVIFSFSAGVEKGRRAHLIKPMDDPALSTVSVVQNKQDVTGPIAQKRQAPLQAAAVRPQIAVNSSAVTVPAAGSAVTADTENLSMAEQKEKSISGSYTVQVASFKKDEYAQKEALMLKKKGYDIIVVPKGSYSIVCVGKFSRKEQASVTLSQLKKTYKDCVLRRL